MAATVKNALQSQFHQEIQKEAEKPFGCSVGIMAYNEESNIERTVRAVLAQHGPSLRLEEVIVVASGCTDQTVPIVSAIAEKDPRVRLCVQEKREGKASAINLFLKQAKSEVVVLIGADVIPEEGAIENLCAPFQLPEIGMVGGRPIPVNDENTFMGHAVHLLWYLHDRLARLQPKLGEVIAFRNVISGIPTNSAVDEISIQALISQLGYHMIYKPECIVYNKGPLTVRDFLKQRRRIYAGHLKVRAQQNYEASTMKVGPILQQLLFAADFALSSPRRVFWTMGTVALEGWARLQGHYDYWRKRDHHIWQMVDSTKNVETEQRRVSHSQSVIVFRLILKEGRGYDLHEERELEEVARKLLPILRSKVEKDGVITVNGQGIVTAVVRADQQGAEVIAQKIKQIAEESTVRVGVRGREVKVMVAYSSLTFASKVSDGTMTVQGPLLPEGNVAQIAVREE